MTVNNDISPASYSLAEIWHQYLTTRSESIRNELMVHYQGIVRQIAQRISRKLPQQVEVDDLVQCGMLGLRDAIQAFDMARKVKFETYCIRRIRGAIFDGLRTLTWAPRDIRRAASTLQRAAEEIQMLSGHSPSAEEVSCHLGIPVEQYQKMAQLSTKVTLLSMNQKMPGLSRPVEIEDRVELRPDEAAQHRDIKELLTSKLTKQEKLILVLYYYEHMTMREIGLILGITESRVSQMHSQVLSLLRSRLEPRLNEMAGTHGITVNL